MRVSISKAADMVGITRATLYRHIDKKGITVLKDEDDNPKIDVSELIRVYGDKVREVPERTPNTAESNPGQATLKHSFSVPESHTKPNPNSSSSVQVEIEVLRERIRRYEAEKGSTETERERERRQLMEQIEHLQSSLAQSQEQQKRLTLLLTDQRDKTVTLPVTPANSDKKEEPPVAAEEGVSSAAPASQMEILEKTIQKLQNQNKRIYYELQKQKELTFFQRLFGN